MELIVTQWDVNQLPPVFRDAMEYELIVTQWDVNLDNYGLGTEIVVRINRYIVGCK